MRGKRGQEPMTRASSFFEDDDLITYEEISLGGKSESEKSSMSDSKLCICITCALLSHPVRRSANIDACITSRTIFENNSKFCAINILLF